MRLSHSTHIGLRTIMRLAAEDENRSRVTTKLIARQVGASERHVAKPVSRLVELGLVQAHRGRSGGLFIIAAGRAASVGPRAHGTAGPISPHSNCPRTPRYMSAVPPGFLRDIQGQLCALGIPAARVQVEQFTPGDAGAPGRVAR